MDKKDLKWVFSAHLSSLQKYQGWPKTKTVTSPKPKTNSLSQESSGGFNEV